MIRSDEKRGRAEPEDVHRGWVAPTPRDTDEAAADRAMAAAERAVAEGTASEDQRSRVQRMAQARTHEQRRAAFRDGD
ncbi:hypothetical protein [Actinomycetospora lemnae]|uniref:Uncharacterized protein n=1 Tax=Actinomycetospora lemnae TaxID=3019891 RepID=A0ABT5SUA7_9PSEU|nr:hypothetical protein [Actinomycetospora sp. DW7H6]MDD7966442.1 hypothetical protein [Actinomycetospora sp. DW7H6]